MPLTYLDFCNGAPCYIAAACLQSRCHLLLRKLRFFAKLSYIIAYFLFCCFVHFKSPMHLFKSKPLDIIINAW